MGKRLDKFLDPQGNKSNAYVRSSKQESELAKRGGRLVPRSGAGGYEKGDIKSYKGRMTIEAKSTSCRSFSINREMLTKLEDAASARSELPLLLVEWLNADGVPEGELAILSMRVLDELLDGQGV